MKLFFCLFVILSISLSGCRIKPDSITFQACAKNRNWMQKDDPVANIILPIKTETFDAENVFFCHKVEENADRYFAIFEDILDQDLIAKYKKIPPIKVLYRNTEECRVKGITELNYKDCLDEYFVYTTSTQEIENLLLEQRPFFFPIKKEEIKDIVTFDLDGVSDTQGPEKSWFPQFTFKGLSDTHAMHFYLQMSKPLEDIYKKKVCFQFKGDRSIFYNQMIVVDPPYNFKDTVFSFGSCVNG